jgi:hypothetical protein
MLDRSGKRRKRASLPTLETCLEQVLADRGQPRRLRPHTLRAYRYALTSAPADPRFQRVEIVRRVLGHRDIRSRLGYAALQDAQVRAALEARAAR